MPHDQIPAPTRSRSIMEAHFKSMRLFRKYCRYMPFLIGLNGMQKFTTPEMSKMQVARYWRTQNKVRSPEDIDNFVRAGYERLYNMQNGDVWGGIILDQISPVRRGNIEKNQGFSYYDEVKFKGKSKFLQNFYEGEGRPNY